MEVKRLEKIRDSLKKDLERNNPVLDRDYKTREK